MSHRAASRFALTLAVVLLTPLAASRAQNDVAFSVDMRFLMYHGFFQPEVGDVVVVAGDFNSWDTSGPAMSDADGDSVFGVTLSLPEGPIQYTYVKSPRGGITGEVVPGSATPFDNRDYTVVPGTQTVGYESFGNYGDYFVPIDVTFQVEMGPYIDLGLFTPGDLVTCPQMFPEPLVASGTLYQRTVPIAAGITSAFKYQINSQSEAWVGPEEASGLRVVTFGSVNETLPPVYFNNYLPAPAQTAEAEPNASAWQANTILIGQTLQGEISAEDDVDYYAFVARSGDALNINLAAPGSDPLEARLSILNEFGTSYFESGLPIRDQFIVPETGLWYLRCASSSDGGGFPNRPLRQGATSPAAPTGAYEIRIEQFVPGPPTIFDFGPTDVNYNSIRLVLSLNANGSATTLRVEYGPTPAYGSVFTPSVAPLQTLGREVLTTDRLTGLEPGSLLYYRVVASNSNGDSPSAGASIQLPPEPTEWERPEVPLPPPDRVNNALALTSIASADQNTFLAAGTYAQNIVRSTDGGDTWLETTLAATVPLATRINAVAFASPTVACAVGGFGGITRSTDAGSTWGLASGPGNLVLYDIAFATDQVGFAVGIEPGDGLIVRTGDGGVSWQVVASALGDIMDAVAVGDASNAIAVGRNGTVYRTTDAGLTWVRGSSLPSAQSVEDVVWISAQIQVVLGNPPGAQPGISNPTVYLTQDGGATWEERPLNLPAFYGLGIACADENSCVVVGTDRQTGRNLFRSADGGLSWTPEETGTTNSLHAVEFFGQKLVAVGAYNTIATKVLSAAPPTLSAFPTPIDLSYNATRFEIDLNPNGALTTLRVEWGTSSPPTNVFDPIVYPAVPLDGSGLRTVITNKISIQPATQYFYRVVASNSGGESASPVRSFVSPATPTVWTKQDAPDPTNLFPGFSLSGIAPRDPNTYLACGDATILKTTDGGAVWVDRSPATGVKLRAIGWVSASTACAVGDGVWRSTDAGETWTAVSLPGVAPPLGLVDVTFPTEQLGLAVGGDQSGGLIARSTDGGASWSVVASGLPFDSTPMSIAMGDGLNGIIGCRTGTLLRTTDGGQTWLPASSPTTRDVVDVQWLTAQSQIILTNLPSSSGATAFLTTDGGASWSPRSPNEPGFFAFALARADANNWVAVGTNPTGADIFRTTDAGLTWGPEESGTVNLLLGAAHVEGRFLAAGQSHTILKSAPLSIPPPTATKLAFGTQPTDATAGAAIAPAVTIRIEDASGNLIASDTRSVSIAIGTNPAGGTLSGTQTVAAVGGVATFADLSIDRAGAGYTLSASASGLTGATSGAFSISALQPPPPAVNLLANGDFEGGLLPPWYFHTNGQGTARTDVSGPTGGQAAHVTLTQTNDNMQLYQAGIRLEPGERYRLTFSARSSRGQNLSVYLHKHTAPFTNYGLRNAVVDLTTNWQTFSVEFVASGFTEPVSDGRLRFWFVGFAQNGDQYFIDDVRLERVGQTPPPPPPPPPPTTVNLLANGSFEDGFVAPWYFHTNGEGSSQIISPGAPGPTGNQAVRITLTRTGDNMQLYQTGISLEPGARYRLTFAAKSPTGKDLAVYVHKHDTPYTNYGLQRREFNLTNSWNTFTAEFVASGFTQPVSDGRLRFWFVGYAAWTDVYFIDDVRLERLPAPSGEIVADVPGLGAGTIPVMTELRSNYPNPFNPSTTIAFALAEPGEARLEVFNTLGERVATLVSGWHEAGTYAVTWQATSDQGVQLPSGVYFARMQAGDYVSTQRMMLLK